MTALFARRGAAAAVHDAFDVPCDDGYAGLRRAGDELLGVLAVDPGPAVPVVHAVHHAGGGVGGAGPRGAEILPAVARALGMRDAAPVGVDIVSQVMTAAPHGPAAHAYRRLLGGLPIAAHRSVHLVMRFRPAAHPAAVAARGGSGVGALRTAIWCLRRLAACLAEVGVAARPLTAAEVTALTAGLTEGRAPGDPALVTRVPLVEAPETLRALLAAPTLSAASSTTVTIRVGRRVDGIGLQTVVRDRLVAPVAPRPGFVDVDGDPRALAAIGLPVAVPAGRVDPDLPWQTGAAAAAIIGSVRIPTGGDGQVVGAAVDGSPVTLRLAGPSLARSEVLGGRRLAGQVLVRLAGLGVTTCVRTVCPADWEPAAARLGPTVRVGGHTSGVQAIVDAADPPVVADPGVTVVRASDAAGGPSVGAHPVLIASRDDPDTVTATAGGASVTVRLVSTPEERGLLGEID
ncbi:type VII secretion protein EccE [Gordonia shandongensis]|uniref:type VII secretion protein EccE n=1 Tax=Gordonia shandongensis TaxID=376351 RepID=UPI000408ACD2|nr:type VII secretion protein EccE [Gordonia shandongensis]